MLRKKGFRRSKLLKTLRAARDVAHLHAIGLLTGFSGCTPRHGRRDTPEYQAVGYDAYAEAYVWSTRRAGAVGHVDEVSLQGHVGRGLEQGTEKHELATAYGGILANIESDTYG